MARSEEHLKEYAADFETKGIEVYTQAADVADLDAFCGGTNNAREEYLAKEVIPLLAFFQRIYALGKHRSSKEL